MATSCSYELQKKNFGFADASAQDFYHSQWFQPRSVFVVYRAFMFTYCMIWSIVNRMYYDRHYPNGIAISYLSNWGEWTLVVHFGIALVVAVYGLMMNEYQSIKRPEPGCCPGNRCNQGDLRWFHHLSWLLSGPSTAMQYIITILYWAFLTNDDGVSMAVVVHQHVMNSVLATIDLFMSRVPVRLLHFIYTCIYGLMYVLVTLILHGTGTKSVFYAYILDWREYPGVSAGVCIAVIFVGSSVAHTIVFIFYHLRALIARKLSCGAPEKSGDNGEEMTGNVVNNDDV